MADLGERDLVLERRSEQRHYSLRLASGRLGEVDPPRTFAGLDLPLAPNSSVGTDPCVSWVAPEEWLISATPEAGLLIDRLSHALEGKLGHVADVTAGLAVYSLSGDGARALLARACSLDVHQRIFPAGVCARTLFARIPALLRAGNDGFQIIFEVSHSTYIEQWFAQARNRVKVQDAHAGQR